MYAKIVIQEENKHKEYMYECTNYTYTEDDEETLFTIIHDEDNITCFSLAKSDTKIYIMNDNGVTIDSYKWTESGTLK